MEKKLTSEEWKVGVKWGGRCAVERGSRRGN